ncbi:hypothetical protein ACFQ3J_21010 [Paenibacillus provencensis]|uniref:Uncharacterized protein n=1 Tax=Paenibacillus provencensis TaxID=441151 RepID=A0ABW3PXB7_9BACL
MNWADASSSNVAKNATQELLRTAVGLLQPITRAPKPGEKHPGQGALRSCLSLNTAPRSQNNIKEHGKGENRQPPVLFVGLRFYAFCLPHGNKGKATNLPGGRASGCAPPPPGS